jgi:hypothetical protein
MHPTDVLDANPGCTTEAALICFAGAAHSPIRRAGRASGRGGSHAAACVTALWQVKSSSTSM